MALSGCEPAFNQHVHNVTHPSISRSNQSAAAKGGKPRSQNKEVQTARRGEDSMRQESKLRERGRQRCSGSDCDTDRRRAGRN
ncbi:hypothetical protein CRENBAI_011242 [Crenichthys baileyi]|uniref:Uncharacterized protein n=1 Tax=Crenichthys baileyi TaxID=28760 RepID=A0AAV9RYL0_9TELE